MNARRSARSTPRTEALLGGFLDHGMSREFEKEHSCAKLCLITKDFAEKKRFDLSLSSASVKTSRSKVRVACVYPCPDPRLPGFSNFHEEEDEFLK